MGVACPFGERMRVPTQENAKFGRYSLRRRNILPSLRGTMTGTGDLASWMGRHQGRHGEKLGKKDPFVISGFYPRKGGKVIV